MALGLRWWAGLAFVCCGVSGAASLFSACSGDTGNQMDATPDLTVGCFTNLTSCLGSCVDLTSDPDNCGSCGHACNTGTTTGQKCVNSSCVQTCGGGSAICGDACADLLGDPNNCGMCGMKCNSGFVCNDGGCALSCQTGYDKCPNDAGETICINPQTNDYNCGGCFGSGGQVCTSGTRCEAGICSITCQQGLSVSGFHE